MIIKIGCGAKYDSKNDTIEIPDRDIVLYTDNNSYCIRFGFDNQDFNFSTDDYDDFTDFVLDILDNTVTFSRIDERYIRVNNRIKYRRHNKKRENLFLIISRTAGIIIGAGVILFSLLLLISVVIHENASLNWVDYYSPIPVAVAGVILGVSLICNVFSKNPVTLIGSIIYTVGIILTSFGMSLMMYLFGSESRDTPTADLVGVTGVFFMFIFFGVFMVIGGLKSRKEINSGEIFSMFIKRIPQLPSEDDMRKIIDSVYAKSMHEAILIHKDFYAKPSLYDSKFGGLPYWDLAREYPVDCIGEKMRMTVQFNLSQLPKNDSLPKSGIIQFFMSNNYSDDYKIIYHESIENLSKDDLNTLEIPVCSVENSIYFEKTMIHVNPYDSAADNLMHDTARELGIPIDETLLFFEIAERMKEKGNNPKNSYLLGCPEFINYDVRPEGSKYNTLLLQISRADSEIYTYNCSSLYWFFINDKDLTNLDFDDIFSEYDCY